MFKIVVRDGYCMSTSRRAPNSLGKVWGLGFRTSPTPHIALINAYIPRVYPICNLLQWCLVITTISTHPQPPRMTTLATVHGNMSGSLNSLKGVP